MQKMKFYGELREHLPNLTAGGCKFSCYTSKIKTKRGTEYYRLFCTKSDKKCKPYQGSSQESSPPKPIRVSTKRPVVRALSAKKLENITDDEAIKLLLNPDVKLTSVQKKGLLKIANSVRERVIPEYSFAAMARKYRFLGKFTIRVGLNNVPYCVVVPKPEEQEPEPPQRTVAWIFRVKKEDIKKETEKAVGIDAGTNKLVWVPKSVIKGWCFKPEGYIVEDWYARQYAKTGGPFVPIDEKTRQVLIEGKYWVEK